MVTLKINGKDHTVGQKMAGRWSTLPGQCR